MNVRAQQPVRLGLHGTLLLIFGALLLTFGPGHALAAGDNVVRVYGYQWSQEYTVKLDDLQGTPTTIKGNEVVLFGMKEVLEAAEGQQSPAGKDFTVDDLFKIEITLPGGGRDHTVSGARIRSGKALPSFYVNEEGVTVMRVPGGGTADFPYSVLSPQLYEPEQKKKSLSVTVSPKKSTVKKSGEKVTFTASPGPLPSGTKVSYRWTIDGQVQSGSGATFTASFDGPPANGSSWGITVTLQVEGYDADELPTSTAIVYYEKPPPRKKNPPKKKQPADENPGGYDPGGYDPGGYDPGGYDPGGTPGGPSDGSADPGQPQDPDQQPQPEPEPAGETVTGQLVDPNQIATVVTPSGSPSGETGEEASPAEQAGDGGGGLPRGVSTALGIGALLGLGGLIEAGAFSGAGRRFRFRP